MTSLAPTTALERLKVRVSSPRAASSITGDYKIGTGVVGVFNSDRFDLRLQRFIGNSATLHAFGSVRVDANGSRIEVRFSRMTWATWVRRFGMLFFALLIAIQLYAALQQPVFWVGVGFLTVMAALTMWSSRIRAEDRALLTEFLEQTFADVRVVEGPLFSVDGSDVIAFASRGDAVGFLEAIDAREGKIHIFTSDGTQLSVRAEGNRVVIGDRALGGFPDQLREALRKSLLSMPPSRRPLTDDEVASASLDELARHAGKLLLARA